MSNGKKPSHISLPAKPAPQDVFSASALDSAPTPSSANESPSGTPYHHTHFDSTASRKSQHRNQLSPYGIGGSSGSRKPTFIETVHPRLRGASDNRDRLDRQSFSSQVNRRTSRIGSIHTVGGRQRVLSPGGDGDDVGSHFAAEGKPPIPVLVPGIRPAYSTPLPLLAMIVLSIAMMSEFLSANVSTPFILRMVRGFFLSSERSHGSHENSSETEALVGFWTGNLVSVFFITQFFTSLLWSSVADKYGRRLVLVVSLLGSAVSVIVFGTSRSLPEAICVRLCQGIFGGSIGVFRGSIRDITDPTNEATAYAILGFAWGMGGVVGPIIGGVFESPAVNYPNSALGKLPIFQTYPYLLATLIAGTILAFGAVLATRLSWDGGPRRPRIALPVDKEEDDNDAVAPTTNLEATPRPESTIGTLRKKTSSVFAGHSDVLDLTPAQMRVATIKDEEAQERNRRASRASFGTAYGYGGIRVKREEMAARAMQQAGEHTEDAGAGDDHEHLGLARKFLLANEENTFNLNELWVSAATAAEDSAVFEEDYDEEDGQDEDESQPGSHLATPSRQPAVVSPYRDRSPLLEIPDAEGSVPKPRLGGLSEAGLNHRVSSAMNRVSVSSRRFSTASRHLPAIYANTGLQTPPAIAAAYETDYLGSHEDIQHHNPGLSAINEGQVYHPSSRSETGTIRIRSDEDEPEIKPTPAESNFQALPKLIILQYGLLAFHDTVHGQIFMTFLVSEYKAGGLGLLPSAFSLLIAIMCLCQLYYQFYLYPHIGPPRGRFNHLQMFRLGSMLFIPAYLTLPMLRRFTNEETPGSPIVMCLLIANMACRYAGGTFSYTSIMVLVNAMSPPHVVGLANGFAQSLVSFGRFIGPVIGGLVWASATAGNPDGYFQPFYVVAITCAMQVSLSFLIR